MIHETFTEYYIQCTLRRLDRIYIRIFFMHWSLFLHALTPRKVHFLAEFLGPSMILAGIQLTFRLVKCSTSQKGSLYLGIVSLPNWLRRISLLKKSIKNKLMASSKKAGCIFKDLFSGDHRSHRKKGLIFRSRQIGYPSVPTLLFFDHDIKALCPGWHCKKVHFFQCGKNWIATFLSQKFQWKKLSDANRDIFWYFDQNKNVDFLFILPPIFGHISKF